MFGLAFAVVLWHGGGVLRSIRWSPELRVTICLIRQGFRSTPRASVRTYSPKLGRR